MGFYALLSPQKRIRAKKQEIRQLKQELNDDSLDFAGTLRLSRKNLGRSLELLALVLPTSLLSMLPALAMIFFVSLLYTYQVPETGHDIKVKVTPGTGNVIVHSGGVSVSTGKGVYYVVMGKEPRIMVYENNRMIYQWTPDMLMSSTIDKKPRWSYIAPEGAGYLPEDSATEELIIDFKPLRLIEGAPRFMGGWEFCYFLALTISAVLVKVKFRIE